MRRPSQAAFCGLFDSGRDARLEDSTEESGITIPIQRAVEIAGSFYVFRHGRERCKDVVRFIVGCSLKSVE